MSISLTNTKVLIFSDGIFRLWSNFLPGWVVLGRISFDPILRYWLILCCLGDDWQVFLTAHETWSIFKVSRHLHAENKWWNRDQTGWKRSLAAMSTHQRWGWRAEQRLPGLCGSLGHHDLKRGCLGHQHGTSLPPAWWCYGWLQPESKVVFMVVRIMK